jgi:hypothetical protein
VFSVRWGLELKLALHMAAAEKCCEGPPPASATVWLPAHKINTKLSATNFRQL